VTDKPDPKTNPPKAPNSPKGPPVPKYIPADHETRHDDGKSQTKR